MKISSIIFFAAILTFSFITDTYSQLQDHFHSASINVSVPVTVNWQKTIHKKRSGWKYC